MYDSRTDGACRGCGLCGVFCGLWGLSGSGFGVVVCVGVRGVVLLLLGGVRGVGPLVALGALRLCGWCGVFGVGGVGCWLGGSGWLLGFPGSAFPPACVGVVGWRACVVLSAPCSAESSVFSV